MSFFSKLFAICGSNEPAPEVDEPEIELEPHLDAIREQMEFYLSNSNIESDSFMKEAINEREDRYVKIATFLTFNRMKSLNATEEDIIEACSASKHLEVNKAEKIVRSKVPFVSDPRRSYRTVHIEGFDETETLDDIKALFKEQYPRSALRTEMRKINRKGGEKIFSGQVNVEVKDEATAKKIVENGILYHGKQLKGILFSDFKANLVSKKKGTPKKDTPKKDTPKKDTPKKK
ncbi:La domain containing protein [Trichomonas vaginalis G3]|uniref:La domain containing protein n=1 Tax=Trichomonas vaginalis (strain ATCC PRA-98 / G3) TaxID=412133 RepID=A2E928_TRIV3|nr:RNA binding [Trichomonas vaginalis G3]EAY10822.1 La domain containing protein [Trichomonas vaginalis G3]KAI5519910.1 RNA binding [Trichomonas vaginalis G3]|eukprot:XP_001323045.1 La domain containing protein [Trichomonas vaginalis G3]